jgi:hypothetical protein
MIRPLWLVMIIVATAIPLAGCEAASAMFSAALWIPGLFLVLIIWAAAVIAFRIRGG